MQNKLGWRFLLFFELVTNLVLDLQLILGFFFGTVYMLIYSCRCLLIVILEVMGLRLFWNTQVI